ncbi:Hyccin domain-containing protein [Cephalotus follicularis]|uniref:Hyccin domain-containing protein n=1 Tax=Cephalotus follicularis TaxID=3775 RepID=A0A1Q3CXP6_CEPFO|nr:Hyccin domain-containing protein [Cephalotus follicularis]
MIAALKAKEARQLQLCEPKEANMITTLKVSEHKQRCDLLTQKQGMDMNLKQNHQHHSTKSPSSSSTTTTTDHDSMQSWWESVSKARSTILSLSSIITSFESSISFSLSSLADSDNPALSLLSSFDAYSLLSSALSAPPSGSGTDPLCRWLYETYLSSDPHLRLIVISLIPLIINIYLCRVHSSNSAPSLSGFEAVLLALYSSETKSRAGNPLLVRIPDLSQPSLYHTPPNKPSLPDHESRQSVGVLSLPLEPQGTIKSTKRPCIVGVALDCYFKQISQMPTWSKVDFCQLATAWAGQDCCCVNKFDQNGNEVVEEMVGWINDKFDDATKLESKGARIPLPWEMLQPMLKILGHCLLGPLNSQDVKDAASVAVRCLYARGSHDLVPQAILATRSLIQLDKRGREAANAAAAANASSNANRRSKSKKPEILLSLK